MFIKIILIGFLVASQTTASTPYTKKEPVVTTTTDISTSFRVEVIPDKGWYWNDKYPSRFKLSKKNTKLDVVIEAWVAKASKAFIKGSVVAAELGTENILIKGKFSLCSATTCRVFSDTFRVRVISQEECSNKGNR